MTMYDHDHDHMYDHDLLYNIGQYNMINNNTILYRILQYSIQYSIVIYHILSNVIK